MTRREYFRRLRRSLGRIPESEKDSLIEYYSEMVEEALDRGKSEEEFFASLDAPEQVAKDYLSNRAGQEGADDFAARPEKGERRKKSRDRGDYGGNGGERERKPRGSILRNPLVLVLLFPFALVALVLALAALIVCIALVVADIALTIGFCVGGIYSVVMSFGLLFSHNALIALMQIGIGFALFGLAMLFELTLRPLFRGMYLLVCLAFHREARPSRGGEAVKARIRVRTAVVGFVMILVGGILGTVAAGGLDWNVKNFADVGDFTQTEQTFALEDSLTVVGANLALDICPAEGEEAKFVYYKNETLSCESRYENGTLTFLWDHDWKNSFREVWKRGLLYNAVISVYNKAQLYLPRDFAGSVKVTSENGAIRIENLKSGDFELEAQNGALKIDSCTFGDLNVRAKNGSVNLADSVFKGLTVRAENGAIVLDDVTAGSIDAEAKNGAVRVGDVTADTVRFYTKNGAVRVDGLSGNDLTLVSENGSVSGSIDGKQSDYKITASSDNGSCNLVNTEKGEKTLTVSTRNGSVKVYFETD